MPSTMLRLRATKPWVGSASRHHRAWLGPCASLPSTTPALPRLSRGGTRLHAHARETLVRGLATQPAGKKGEKKPVRPTLDAPEATFSEVTSMLSKHVWPQGQPLLKARTVAAVSCLLGAKVANVQVPIIFKWAIDSMNEGCAASLANGELVLVPMGLLLSYGAARMGASLLKEMQAAVFAAVSATAIRSEATNAFRHVLFLDNNFHLSRQTGALTRVLDRGGRGMRYFLSAALFNITPTIFEIALVCGILTVGFGPLYAAVALSTVATYAVFTTRVTAARTKIRQAMNRADNEAQSKAVDALMNHETVKYFNAEEHEVQRYTQSLRVYEDHQLRVTTTLAGLNFGQNMIFSTAMTAMLVMAAEGVAAGTMTIGDIVMVNGLLFQLSFPLNFLGSVYREISQAITDMENLLALRKANTSIVEKPDAILLPGTEAAEGPGEESGIAQLGAPPSIEFRDVSFAYQADAERGVEGGEAAEEEAAGEARAQRLLRSVSFSVPPGSTVGIVGSSGSGKSTILKLLYRTYDVTEGQVLVGGVDVRDLQLKSLQSALSVVSQDTALFNDTIRYNIAYGVGAEASQEEIEAAAKAARVHETTVGFPEGYDTNVGERGMKLSGGEKQRVGLARALLYPAPVLLLDEATSALDSGTEQHILRSLREHRDSNRGFKPTIIAIAHRLSTLVDADQILVLQDGAIAEMGSHEALMAEGGLYYEAWNRQQQSSHAAAAEAAEEAGDEPMSIEARAAAAVPSSG